MNATITTTLHFHKANNHYGLLLHPHLPPKPWSAFGIFSEVFERYFVTQHKHFKDLSSINMACDLAAMGYRYYFYHTLQPFFFSRMAEEEKKACVDEIAQVFQLETFQSIQEQELAYWTKLCTEIPYQATNSIIDGFLRENWRKLRERIRKNPKRGTAKQLYTRLDISKGAILRLYRWGFHNALLMVNNNDHNRKALDEFYTVFEQICQLDPEELAQHFSHVEFKIKAGSAVQWDARFITYGNVSMSYKYFNIIPKALKAA